jgi:hypothetical protein
VKATINGIIVEGTPQEILAYQKELNDIKNDKLHATPFLEKQWALPKCPNEGSPCFCTGVCFGNQGTSISFYKLKHE